MLSGFLTFIISRIEKSDCALNSSKPNVITKPNATNVTRWCHLILQIWNCCQESLFVYFSCVPEYCVEIHRTRWSVWTGTASRVIWREVLGYHDVILGVHRTRTSPCDAPVRSDLEVATLLGRCALIHGLGSCTRTAATPNSTCMILLSYATYCRVLFK